MVGGGVVGLCCARSLARRGVPVVVLERDEIGRGASFGNAGTISPAHPPINAPGRWRELIRSMVDPLSPLYIPPRLDPGLWKWLLSFARHCGRDHVEHCRRVMAPLARVTPDLHDEIARLGEEEPGIDLGYRADGYLEIFRTRGGGRAVVTPEGELEASAVILATGAYSPDLYDALGCPLPVVPAKGYHVDRPNSAPGTPRLDTACLLVETAVFCTPMPGRLRLAGTLEFSGIDHDLRERRLRQLTRGARLYLEGLDEAPASSRWCGLRPCTPDGLPVVGPLPGSAGVYAATGHAMLGLTFGPVTGELLAELLVDGESSIPIDGLDPGRF